MTTLDLASKNYERWAQSVNDRPRFMRGGSINPRNPWQMMPIWKLIPDNTTEGKARATAIEAAFNKKLAENGSWIEGLIDNRQLYVKGIYIAHSQANAENAISICKNQAGTENVVVVPNSTTYKSNTWDLDWKAVCYTLTADTNEAIREVVTVQNDITGSGEPYANEGREFRPVTADVDNRPNSLMYIGYDILPQSGLFYSKKYSSTYYRKPLKSLFMVFGGNLAERPGIGWQHFFNQSAVLNVTGADRRKLYQQSYYPKLY